MKTVSVKNIVILLNYDICASQPSELGEPGEPGELRKPANPSNPENVKNGTQIGKQLQWFQSTPSGCGRPRVKQRCNSILMRIQFGIK